MLSENIKYDFIDTTLFTDDRYTKWNKAIVHSLDRIATKIKFKTKYVIIGVVHYINFFALAKKLIKNDKKVLLFWIWNLIRKFTLNLNQIL